MRPECVAQKIESLFRFAATQNHEVVRVSSPCAPETPPPARTASIPSTSVHGKVRKRWADHSALRRAAIISPAARHPLLPLLIPFLDRHLQPHPNQMQHVLRDDRSPLVISPFGAHARPSALRQERVPAKASIWRGFDAAPSNELCSASMRPCLPALLAAASTLIAQTVPPMPATVIHEAGVEYSNVGERLLMDIVCPAPPRRMPAPPSS